ncbi:MAG: hypothetical protein JXQ84_04290 [Rhodospirillaceae bacterium]|nr:hypothetical protein [Rhodospirillaceae bacterium]
MTIDATQTQGLTRALTQDTLESGPQGKIALKIQEDDKSARSASGDDSSFSLFGDDGLSFWDVLDVINPLQHIPVVNSIYRELTGDEIKPAMKLIGGTLFGGVIGLSTAAVDVAVEGLSGKDLGEHAMAMIEGQPDGRENSSQFAANGTSEDGWRDDEISTAQAVAQTPQDLSLSAATLMPLASGEASASASAAAQAAQTTPGSSTTDNTAEADDSILPPWSPVLPSTITQTAQTADASLGKSFPAPKRRNAYADSPRSIHEIRAETKTSAAVISRGNTAIPPGLSENAMRAAGLTPDLVQAVLQDHGGGEAQPNTPSNVAKQSAAIGTTNTPAGTENMWFYSAMNQALDKYSAAKSLGTVSEPTAIGDGVPQ